ncbi:GNAT family N-acetyltransferase [Spongiactinospora sp. TRM90649]|uniref:GNAT family N-acetyltransferase n=1 Tax=Spongiactinospora sp. TRM90649 TaxID=3031114 RepID=UPI0023F7FF7B|nr:GNAT family N-acetyltransferase [Spongiactinospora sp. TRM90649]MDF5752744.1 GNAT family N-acetyltransferase [Spongiactinospora sp. TRM90649]
MTAEGAQAEPVLVKCADIDDDLFVRFYETVLAPAFPPAELVGLETARVVYRAPEYGHFGTIAMVDGEPVGGALGSFSPSSGILLLDYLAVRPEQRGRGLGSALIGHLRTAWRPKARPVAVLAEVEDPARHSASVFGDPVARLRLYDRTGWSLLPVDYFQPSLAPGLPRVQGMFLICLGPAGPTVPTEAVLAFLDEYVRGCEGDEAARSDPEYLALREQVSSWGPGVPLWPISRAPEVRRRAGHA